ncbi:MAG TPA: HlyD family efflux transporter periplasmic adaptor subunit [Anaerolineae bacterium]|nr:HlyD family efflux transporter periplasmic adaptor subunit [Anaerolineae bacterium]
MIMTTVRIRCKLVVPLLVVQLALAGCAILPAGERRSDPQEEATPTPIPTAAAVSKPTYQVAVGEITKLLVTGGRIVPVTEKELFFKTSGRVRTVSVKTGDTVKAGQVLADLEIDDLELELEVAELGLARAQEQLQDAETDLQNNTRRALANLDIARENLAIVRAHDPAPSQTAAEVALELADLFLDQAQAAYDEIGERNDRDASAEAAALQRAILDQAATSAAHDLALQDVTAHSHQIVIAERQVDLAQIALDECSGGVDPLLVHGVKGAQLAVDKLQSAIGDAQIVAPFDGRVQVAFMLTEGAAVDAFFYVATVSDPTELEVSVETVNVSLNELSQGMPATVSLLNRPGVELQGSIRRMPASGVLARQDSDRSLRIALEASSTEAGYRSGDLVRIAVALQHKPDALWLPPAAIRTFEGRTFVTVQEGGGQRRVDVTLGIEGSDRVEIIGGLNEGQVVVGP